MGAGFRTNAQGSQLTIAALAAASCLVIYGCGIVHVPYPKTLPQRRLTTVVVLDYEKRQPLNDATVSFGTGRWVNWMSPLAFWRVEGMEPDLVRVETEVVS